MSGLLKKKAIAYKIAQATMAFVHLFVTFVLPLNHTCGLCENYSKCHCDNPGHYCGIAIHTDAKPEVVLKQDICKTETLSHSKQCIACTYSIISKSTQVNTTKPFINIQVHSLILPVPALRVVKQSERFSSVFLRAPPIITS